jgi:hypothetical protein
MATKKPRKTKGPKATKIAKKEAANLLTLKYSGSKE